MATKSELWAAFKELGVKPMKQFVQYTTEELEAEYISARQSAASEGYKALVEEPDPPVVEQVEATAGVAHAPTPDADGLVWLQKEVRKPAYPKPRGRRVLKYTDPGVREVTVSSGQYTETYEMPGDRNKAGEIKITLPSYQVGIYVDPRFPFRVIVYNDNRGFHSQDVDRMFGGRDLVPDTIKRKYVENVLCYDMRTTIRTITAEARDRGLLKGMSNAS